MHQIRAKIMKRDEDYMEYMSRSGELFAAESDPLQSVRGY